MQETSKSVIVIPPGDKIGPVKLKVAVYCRVSTRSKRQERSLENQITHYRETIDQDERYELVEIYYDFGVSGFTTQRLGFKRMVADALTGRFELLITKSITRFARNTAAVLETARLFREFKIGIYFELQAINTLSLAGELLMTLYAAFGQAESEGARKHTLMAIGRRYREGCPPRRLERSLGYKKTQEGEYLPNEKASVVVEIFEMAAEGFTVAQITNYLNAEGIKARKGGLFHRSSVLRILQNEAYKGDLVYQKYFVDENRRQVRNRGEKDLYYIEEDHVPIVSRELWDAAQPGQSPPAPSEATLRSLAAQPGQSPPAPSEATLHSPIPGPGTASDALAAAPPLPPLTDRAYPYRSHLFCAACGHRLMRAVRAGRVLWECSGKTRFTGKFCEGVSIPETALALFLPIDRDCYFAPLPERGRVVCWQCQPGEEWEKTHRKKRYHVRVPELTETNYPYKDRIFCKYCGSRLRRIISNAGKVSWICDNLSRNGKAACKGIRIPDERLQRLKEIVQIAYIGKEKINGTECYGYSGKPDQKRI